MYDDYLLLLSTIVAMVPVIGCGPKDSSAISVTIQNKKSFPNVTVVLENKGPNAEHLWERHNSWGWSNLSFCGVLTNGTIIPIKRREAEFSKNGPTYITLKPEDRHNCEVRLDDGWWTITDQELQEIKYFCVIYSIQPTKESETLNVWTGVTISNWRARIDSEKP